MDLAAALRRGVLLDTNILLLLGVGLVRADLVGRFKRTEAYQRRDFIRLHQWIRHANRVVTTPHILAEFSNLFFRGASRGRESPMAALNAIRAMAEIVVVRDEWIASPELLRLGVTDVGIVVVACREQILVMTDDAALFRQLETEQCAVVNINHLRSDEFLRN